MVERVTWMLACLAVALFAGFGDALWSALRGRFRRAPRREEPAPANLMDLMTRDLASGDPRRMERASAAFLRIPGSAPVPYLTGLVRHQDGEVARRAALILYERQDPEGLPSLYQYLADARS